jgi:FAD:protein FMN transferase
MRAAAVIGVVCLASACRSGAGEPAAPSAARAPSPPPAAAPPPAAVAEKPEEAVYKQTREMMGTIISITVVGEPEAKAAPAVSAALDEMKRLEGVLSEWLPDSEISRINAAAGEHAVKVSDDTLAVVQAGLAVSRFSHGAFDLSWAALRGLYSFEPGHERVPDPAEIKARLPLIDYRKIKVDARAHTVMLLEKGMLIGTGGIAKGYALDRAGAVLKAAGIQNYMLFGGGQVQISGKRRGRPWRVGIQHPRRQDYFGFVEATSGSISTSGDYEHYFIKNGKRWHHIIDTDTGLPVEHTTSVTVLAESGLYADALSTALFVLGAQRALALLPKAPVPTEAVILDRDLHLYLSPGMRDKLVLRAPLPGGQLPQ